ncbi:MAG TPA: succinate dehydrogenase cytochrome b558 subunit [Symbiobacteriaceae bacterium]|nr:succinate dehydrogenase cytochrome b558 subunit [Symbiobacteriaceae bacterium]
MREFFRRNHFLLRRLHSLSGIVPVGGFLLFHLFENSKAMQSAESYNEAIRHINAMPFVLGLEIFAIFLPLYFHALYGIYIAFDAKHNVSNYSYGRNVAFVLQRVSGLVTLAFVTWHIWEFRIQKALGAYGTYVGGESMAGLPTFDVVQKSLQNNVIFTVYIIGIVAAAYHLCNGLYTFLITWGVTIGPKSQRVSNIITNAAFVAVSALGIAAAVAFR